MYIDEDIKNIGKIKQLSKNFINCALNYDSQKVLENYFKNIDYL